MVLLHSFLSTAMAFLYPMLATADPISQDGLCGANGGSTTCVGSAFGNCCSLSDYCGSGDDYCNYSFCLQHWSTCDNPTVHTPISTDGSCGSEGYGLTCTGSAFGGCCSIYGSCGDTYEYCNVVNCD